MKVEFSPIRNEEVLHEEVALFGKPNHLHSQAGRSRHASSRTVPGARQQFSAVLSLTQQVRRHGCLHDGANEGAGRRESALKEDVRRGAVEGRDYCRGHAKKVVAPSRRREMAQRAVRDKGISIRLACDAFGISQTCYRYEAKLSSQNSEIADWLIRLTINQRNWGFGLCFLYLRNVKGYR